ncbi:hypothetical protein CIW83_13355 [Tissierella sp. P1]|nr:hypothetical protein CIW83_13355 [Tissierella sp. P1]
MFHVEKIMFHAADGFFRETSATMKTRKQNKKSRRKNNEKTNYGHTAHPVHGTLHTADDGFRWMSDGCVDRNK